MKKLKNRTLGQKPKEAWVTYQHLKNRKKTVVKRSRIKEEIKK